MKPVDQPSFLQIAIKVDNPEIFLLCLLLESYQQNSNLSTTAKKIKPQTAVHMSPLLNTLVAMLSYTHDEISPAAKHYFFSHRLARCLAYYPMLAAKFTPENVINSFLASALSAIKPAAFNQLVTACCGLNEWKAEDNALAKLLHLTTENRIAQLERYFFYHGMDNELSFTLLSAPIVTLSLRKINDLIGLLMAAEKLTYSLMKNIYDYHHHHANQELLDQYALFIYHYKPGSSFLPRLKLPSSIKAVPLKNDTLPIIAKDIQFQAATLHFHIKPPPLSYFLTHFFKYYCFILAIYALLMQLGLAAHMKMQHRSYEILGEFKHDIKNMSDNRFLTLSFLTEDTLVRTLPLIGAPYYYFGKNYLNQTITVKDLIQILNSYKAGSLAELDAQILTTNCLKHKLMTSEIGILTGPEEDARRQAQHCYVHITSFNRREQSRYDATVGRLHIFSTVLLTVAFLVMLGILLAALYRLSKLPLKYYDDETKNLIRNHIQMISDKLAVLSHMHTRQNAEAETNQLAAKVLNFVSHPQISQEVYNNILTAFAMFKRELATNAAITSALKTSTATEENNLDIKTADAKLRAHFFAHHSNRNSSIETTRGTLTLSQLEQRVLQIGRN